MRVRKCGGTGPTGRDLGVLQNPRISGFLQQKNTYSRMPMQMHMSLFFPSPPARRGTIFHGIAADRLLVVFVALTSVRLQLILQSTWLLL